ncbi:MAG: sulfotransferase [Candidatus Obscuribacterales bacterium]|nr:sulfotransferase [Candidatus Obscuribacterales bacterium]
MSDSSVDENKLTGPLIICGMHRSGTSVASAILARCGLDIGSNLNPAGAGNVQGHYEDLDFVRFHEEIFKGAGHGPEGWMLEKVDVNDGHRKEAQLLLAKRKQRSAWGWKDPRTTLLLDLWSEVIPDAKFLFMIRAPWEVADSLIRRGDRAFKECPSFAIKVWVAYNQLVLDYFRRKPDSSLIVGVDCLERDPQLLIDSLQEKFAISLEPSFVSVFDPDLMNRRAFASEGHFELLEQYFPEAIALWSELTNCCPPLSSVSRKSSSDLDRTRQLILDNRRLSKDAESLRLRINQLSSLLEQSASALRVERLHLQSAKCELGQLRHELSLLRGTRVMRLREKGLRLKNRAAGYLRKFSDH